MAHRSPALPARKASTVRLHTKVDKVLTLSTRSSATNPSETVDDPIVIDDHSSVEEDAISDDNGDPEKQLDYLKRSWRSPIYGFFKSNVAIKYENGRLYHFFPCAARKCKVAAGGVRRFQDSKDKNSTANLKAHAIKCFGAEAVVNVIRKDDTKERSGSVFASFARPGQQPVKFSYRAHNSDEARAHIVKWVTESNRPVSIVKDREFRELFCAGRPTLDLPSASTVSRDIKTCFKACQERIAKILRNYEGRLHIATDAWTSPNHRAFVAWTAHLEHQGTMFSFLLDIVEVAESHTGAAMAKAFQNTLECYGIKHKLLAVNADNASSNNTQSEVLAGMENSFEEAQRVCCFNHTLQLSSKAILKPFGLKTSGDANEDLSIDAEDEVPPLIDFEDDEDEGGADETEDWDVVEDDAGDEGEDGDDVGDDELLADTAVVKESVSKLRQLSFAIIRSTTIALPAWRKACAEAKLKPRLLPRDVATRWNSTYDMIRVALEYRRPIDLVTADKGLKLRKYELDDEEWIIIKDLIDVLEQYKKATIYFSRETTSIAAVIPAMDRLNTKLNRQTKEPYHPSIRAAMKLAAKKLDHYYSLTDSSDMYRIAMVLHPGLKLQYFRSQNWKDEWIQVAEDLVRDEYKRSYEGSTQHHEDEATKDADAGTSNITRFDDDFADYVRITIDAMETAQPTNELEDYLRLPVENVKDPLKWWYENRRAYPNLSRMARDYLSIPATSTAVERVFSQGRQLLHFTRNGLLGSSVRAFLCLGSWCRVDLITAHNLLSDIKARGKRHAPASPSEAASTSQDD